MATYCKLETTLPKESLKISKAYRQEILNSLDDTLDKIRTIAEAQYIIPDKYKDKGIRYKYKHQKTDPVKLTSRTGALKKMLHTGVGQWKKGTSTHKSMSPAIQVVSKATQKNTKEEQYEGTISAIIKDRGAISSRRTSQQLMGRFFWDLPNGVRGKRRPFLTAAEKDVDVSGVENLAQTRLRRIGVL